MGIFKAVDGYKTYIQLFVMLILLVLEEFTAVQIPVLVYQMIGIGAGITAKMKIDAIMAKK